jgi:hypothetical protein
MSPSTQVSLIALILFFAVAGVSLAGLERSRIRLASKGLADKINALTMALREAEEKDWNQLPRHIRTRILYSGAAVLLISVILIAVQFYFATPPQPVQRIPE